MPAVKIGPSRQVVIPKRIYDELGLVPGDYLEVAADGGKVTFTPKALVDKEIRPRLPGDGRRFRSARSEKQPEAAEEKTDSRVGGRST